MTKTILNFLLFICSLGYATAQNQALYYFDGDLSEISKTFPNLDITGNKGFFEKDIVPKFGKTTRKVYRFPENSGLVFNNKKANSFVTGSYGLEMYFKYDNGDFMLYNQLMGDKLKEKQNTYIHLVTTRDAATKKVNIFLDGKLQMEFVDTDNNMESNPNSKFIFFSGIGKQTTSGAVAMIKIYNYFIDDENAKNIFNVFGQSNVALVANGTLKNLFFVRSQAILLPESNPELENLLKFLDKNPHQNITLIGHTDNVGDFNLNIKLSKERAEAVKKYLTANGIKSNRITTNGFGSLKPMADNESETSRQKNRRVELVLEK